jgi:hypothetical protein
LNKLGSKILNDSATPAALKPLGSPGRSTARLLVSDQKKIVTGALYKAWNPQEHHEIA